MKNKSFILDFDSTFIQTEALDELARIALNDHPHCDASVAQIQHITAAGMEGSISLSESLTRRLALLQANKQHIEILITQLQGMISTSFLRNSEFLKQNSEHIYIVSSGFKEYILPVVTPFHIKPEHVFANTFTFDERGNITGLDRENPLSKDQGKVHIVNQLNLRNEIWAIGDGMTDYEIRAANAAHVFCAFTENISRPMVVANADQIVDNFDKVCL